MSGPSWMYLPTGKPRGPRPVVSPEVMFETLKSFPIFNNDGSMKHMSDPVFAKAVAQMPGLKVKNMYYFLMQNRRSVRANLLKYHNIEPIKKISTRVEQPSKKKFHNFSTKVPDFSYYDTIDNEDEDEVAKVNDFHQLILLTKFKQYKNSICELNYHKFSVIYFDQEQINVWKDLSNLQSTVSFVVLDKIISSRLLSNIVDVLYMFALAIKIENSVILLAQMVCESTHSLLMENFLNLWLQNSAPAPSHIVVDYLYEMLNGVCRVFNFCTFNDYNTRCYKYLLKEELDLPDTLLQIDIISMVKIVDSWENFNKTPQSTKDFYLCSIMYLSTITELNEFTEAVISILTLCQSPNENENTEKRKKSLWTHLTSSTIQRLHQKYMDFVLEESGYRSFSHLSMAQNKDKHKPKELLDYINTLKIKSLDFCSFSNDEKSRNIFCCKNILEDLIKLFSEFPSWTKILFKKDNCSYLVSLCSSKHFTYLNELKKPLRPSKFIKYHIKKLKCLTLQGKALAKIAKKNTQLVPIERKNKHLYLTYNVKNNIVQHDNRIEINLGELAKFNTHQQYVCQNEDDDEDNDIGLELFKTNVQSAAYALVELNKSIKNLLNTNLEEEEAVKYVKVLFDCCTEVESYDNVFGTIAEKLSKKTVFADALKQIFSGCYNTASLLSKNEIKNTCKLFAHLLITDSISWGILSILKLKEEEMTIAKQSFIKELLQEISEFCGISKLERKIKQEANQSTFKGLFPDNILDASYAETFFKSFGFNSLWSVFKENMYQRSESVVEKDKSVKVNLKRSVSDTSIASGGSDDSAENYVIKLKLSDLKKASKKKKVIVIE